jgi:DNA helicase IV
MLIIFICLSIILSLYFYQVHNKNKKEIAAITDFLQTKEYTVIQAVNEFDSFLSHDKGYFANYKKSSWLIDYQALYQSFKGSAIEKAKISRSYSNTLKKFFDYYNNAESIRGKFNVNFTQQELLDYKNFLDTASGKPLDNQQRTAIIEDEDANLVIAGAGSGKTTTIVGKVKYVIDRYQSAPDEILLISFTRKSAATLASRVNVEGVLAKTFHSFGIDVIKAVEGKKPTIFEEQQFKPFIINTFNELIEQEEYLALVNDYFTNFLKPVKTQFDFENHGQYIQYIKDHNFRTYKGKSYTFKGKETIKMEVVKSIEECRIANFLLFNGIDYKYEFPYEHQTATLDRRQYKPDFTIFQDGKKYYLEHQAVSKDGNVPPFFAEDGETQEEAKAKYWSKINWAREVHNKNETYLIETYSHELFDGSWVDALTERLQKAGIVLKPKTPKEIWEIINYTASDEIDGFVSLFQTFIALMKSNNFSIGDVIKRNSLQENKDLNERHKRYIDILEPLYRRYEELLSERQEIDFSDMINKASDYILDGQYEKKFDYIIIDEFQDISIGRYKLIKAIKEVNPKCKLFCVGDDWQSIYRFTGSDITLFKEFEQYFGYSIKSKIETTYRFCNPLIKLSSDFILKNENQTAKTLIPAFPERKTTYELIFSESGSQNDVKAVKAIFDKLKENDVKLNEKSILILGRYGFDIKRLADKDGTFRIKSNVEIKEDVDGVELTRTADVIEYNNTDELPIKAEFLTVHKSKGLEADIVIIINCNSGKHGFPSEMSDDKVLNLLLSEADQFENGEERRLFYVAMTRAKEQVFFVASESFKSKFITEIEIDTDEKKLPKCPNCKTSDLIIKKKGIASNGSRYAFVGCTNYLYGCNYSKTLWDNSTRTTPATIESFD